MDSLILGLEEHKSKSKPRPVTSITRIIHLREGRARGVRRGGADWVSLFLLLFAEIFTPATDVTPWVIYKCLIMRLFLPFSLSIHQARCGGLCLVWMGLWDKTKYLERDAATGRNNVVVLDSTVKWKWSNRVVDWVVTGRGWKNWLHSLANLLGEWISLGS